MSFLKLPDNDWAPALVKTLDQKQMHELNNKVESLYESENVLPKHDYIFRALTATDYHDIKVVILGQDPYPNPVNAQGLAFSADPQVPIPASLRNIYLERQHDLGLLPSKNGDLRSWTKQGVLLLNTVLTVQAYHSGSHSNIGWENFTDGVIKALNQRHELLVYLLWGRKAQAKEALIKHNASTLILKSAHPSPFSANNGFFYSYPFSKTNHFLAEHHVTPIDWRN